MSADDIILLITDRDLTVVGDPIAHWTSVEAVQRFNAPGSGLFVAPARRPLLDFLRDVTPSDGDWLPDWIEPSYRVVMVRGDDIWLAGPIETWTYVEDDTDAADGVITVTWTEDMAWLGARVTYPVPASDAESQTAAARWTGTGNAEDLMRSLVNLNAGPGALTARQVPSLILGPDNGVGTSITWGTRFAPLLDDLRAMALAGGGLGFKTYQDGTDIEFEVYDPPDRTTGADAIRFSRGLGNLRSVSLSVTAPQVTAAIVGADGEGTARNIYEYLNASGVSDWGRLERFVDQRGTTDSTELAQAGDEALTEGSESVRLETVTVDTEDVQFGRDYPLGARVSVEVWPGREVADLVREAHLTADDDGVQVSVMVGTGEDVTDPAWVRRIRNLDRRLGRLEGI